MLKLHPTFLTKNRRKEFAILPYEEFVALLDILEDMEDIALLEEARKQDTGHPGFNLEEVKKRLGL